MCDGCDPVPWHLPAFQPAAALREVNGIWFCSLHVLKRLLLARPGFVCLRLWSVGDRAVGRISGAFGRPGTARPVGQPVRADSAGNYTSCDLLFHFPIRMSSFSPCTKSRQIMVLLPRVSRSTKVTSLLWKQTQVRSKQGSIVSSSWFWGLTPFCPWRFASRTRPGYFLGICQITGRNVPPHRVFIAFFPFLERTEGLWLFVAG